MLIGGGFNPRSYARSDALRRHPAGSPVRFNPRSYARSDKKILRSPFAGQFQSALLRKERRVASQSRAGVGGVSIRAPTQGATKLFLLTDRELAVSIRAPTQGATRGSRGSRTAAGPPVFQSALLRKERPGHPLPLMGGDGFNPRSYARSDAQAEGRVVEGEVSIRAPTQGATRPRRPCHQRSGVSIRAPTQGATRAAGAIGSFGAFQSALLRKERRGRSALPAGGGMFQSALLRKERLARTRRVFPSRPFQSALLRKERPASTFPAGRIVGFQSALLRKERLRDSRVIGV